MSAIDTVITPMEMTQRLTNALASSVGPKSLPEYTAPTRLSPIVLIDKKALSVDDGMMQSLLQTLLSIYAGNYLKAISLSMNIRGVNVLKILDTFATDRDIIKMAGIRSNVFSMESANGSMTLPTFGEETKPFSLEAMKDSIKSITEQSNLAVGKLIEVNLEDGESKITIPVSINLVPKTIDSQDIVHITSYNSIDKSMKGRWHQWRSGEIRFLADYLLNLDLIEADKKALLADKTGTMLGQRSKKAKSIIAAVASGNASPNLISTMLIVTKDTAKEMEIELKGKLSSSRVRDQYFDSNVLMSLVVLDPVLERFTLHQRGIAESGTYTLEDIKDNAKRANGVDIESVLKAYKLGESPTL